MSLTDIIQHPKPTLMICDDKCQRWVSAYIAMKGLTAVLDINPVGYDNIQQTGGVISMNPDPKWPDGYFLALENMGIKNRYWRFYTYWLHLFFSKYPARRRRDLGRVEIENFIHHLNGDSGIADWQVLQARDAVEIYYERFRGIALDPIENSGPSTVTPRTSSDSDIAQRVNIPALEKSVTTALRIEHYALKTEKAYLQWIKRFVAFHDNKKPSYMGAAEIHQFLSDLALNKKVASSTQNQALNAIVFLYRKVVRKEIGDFSHFPRARHGKRLPIVLSRRETHLLLSAMDNVEGLIARLIYGTGMRVTESLRLRIQDISFDLNEIIVRSGKGDKDRRVPLPASLKPELLQHIDGRRKQYEDDREKNMHEVELPNALHRKYPNAPYEWRWQFVFAGSDYSIDPRSGVRRRHHVHEIRIQRAVKKAVIEAQITARATPPPYITPLFCNTPSGSGTGHTHGTRVARSCRC